MPTLADLDDPRPSRWPGFLLGTLVALPLAAVFVWVMVGVLPNAILGSAVEYDDRLRQEDSYMQAVCWDLEIPRDEELCECVLAVEYPSLDCRLPFMHWSLMRMTEQCSDPATFDGALAFCSCVQTIASDLAALEPDSKEARQKVQDYASCTELEPALFLPQVDQL
ncbi:hypothetical protein ACNOYE_10995 [Nannocystaceae bacterium ST9]